MRTRSSSQKHFQILLIILLAISVSARGAYLRDVPQSVLQPDGSLLKCFASGDEYYSWLHDKAGYTIIQDPQSGYYVYALKTAEGDLAPSPFIAGRVDPRFIGLEKGVRRSTEKLMQIRSEFIRFSAQESIAPAPKTGIINNLVVFIRFSDESEFTDAISTYSNMFNSSQSGVNSMYRYFLEASYSGLSINASFYPIPTTTVVSYQDSQPRNYYKPYNATTNPIGYQGGDNGTERRDREHILLKNAVNAISAQVPVGLVIDGDGDGMVDNVCFVISGSPTGWSSLLWPHMWSLYSQTATVNGKRVYTYNFQLQTSLNVGVLCHEMFHSLGSPDLYHYSFDGLHPVWYWDLMEYNANPPQHMGAYMKFRYGTWISSVPEITVAGTYTLNPLTSSTGNCYKIRSPNSSTEYFIVEYRKRSGTFESSLPADGLLVYRINTSRNGLGNSSGPPDEVYIYRPDGTTTTDGSPANAVFSSAFGRTAINDATNPSSFLSTSAPGGLSIFDIGAAGNTISFTVGLTGVTLPTVTTTAVTSITATGAVSGGTVTSDGGASVTDRGVCWSGTSNPTIANSHTHDGTGTGTFISAISGLVPATVYHVRAYATNSSGTAYGSDLQFSTAATIAPPAVTTAPVTNLASMSAQGGGTVTSDGGASVTDRGACWSTASNPTIADAHTHNGTGTGSFVSSLTGLTPGTAYHVRAYATNSAGTGYGADLPFTTTTGTAFLIPFGSLDNGNLNIGNISPVISNLTIRVLDGSGLVRTEKSTTLPARGIMRTWDLIGNIYSYGKPLMVEISGDQLLAGDNIKWASPPNDTVGAGFTCGPLALMKGTLFYFPFSAFGQSNGYAVIANTTPSSANVVIEVTDQTGVLKKTSTFVIGAKGVVRSWELIGSIQAIADPALIRIASDQDVVVEAVRWEQNRRGWGFAIFPSSAGSGTSFVIPFGALNNGNINLANTSSTTANVTLRIINADGINIKEQSFTLPGKGVIRTWDVVGNIYSYGKPVTVEVASDQPLVGDNIKWASPPNDTVSAGFSCGPLSLVKGKTFYFPFSAFGQSNAYAVLSNTASNTAAVTIEVYDPAGVLKKTSNFTIGAKGVVRSWEYLGSIQAVADPALLKISSDQDLVVEAVRWEQNRRGWGFAILPFK